MKVTITQILMSICANALTGIGFRMLVVPRTQNVLNIFDPTIPPTAMSF